MEYDEQTRAAGELLRARERLERALRIENKCEGVPVAVLSMMTHEANRLADLLEVMLK